MVTNKKTKNFRSRITKKRDEYDPYFRLNPVPMLVYNQKTLEILDANSAALKLYGYSKEEVLTMTIEDIRPSEDIPKLKKFFLENDSDTRSSSYWRHIKKDGVIFYVDVFSQKIELPNHKEARLISVFDVTKRKMAEDNLNKSEQRFRELTDLLPQIIFEIDLTGQILYCNKIAYDTFQYPYDTDLSTLNIFEFVSPSHVEIAQKNFTELVTTGKMNNVEYELIRKDGSTFSAVALVSPIFQNQVPVGFRGTLIDISELKHVHKELLYSQMKYSSLFENAYSMMMILDPDSQKLIDVNHAAAKFYGYSIEELKQLYLRDITTVNDEEIKSSINNAISFKNNQFIRLHKLSDGSRRFVEVYSSPIIIDGKVFLFSVINDVHEKILAEEKLKKLNKAIEQSPVSAVITDRNGIIEYVNPKFCEVTGYKYDEAIGKNPRILKSSEHGIGHYRNLWTTITSGRNWYGEFKNKKKDGSFYWESASISPILDDNGQISHFVAIKEDITDRKLKEKELQLAKEIAEEANQLKSSFLANMSHELRTPLVGILGYADILSNELQEVEFKEMATTIIQSGQQLVDTLNSILDLSRIEANHNHLEINTYELKTVLKETCSLFQSVAKNKNLYIRLNLPSENIYIDSDNHLLNKIFNNLFNNSLKFTSVGGVTINVNFDLEEDDKFVRIEFIDTGIGISEEFQKVIFEPFRQASEGLSRAYGGTGLGLTLTKKFVELIHGTISVYSQVGHGSTFTLRLPLSKRKEQKTSDENLQRGEDCLDLASRPSLLLVEDDIVNAQIVQAYLTQYFDIEHVLDGQISIEKCKSKTYNIILMDIALKGIDGTTAMQEIKKISKHYSEIPIIAFTAFAMLGDKESFLKAGFSHYISKPFTKSKLFEILRQIFEDKLN